jgi:CHRD domain-containing protein
MRLLNRLAWTAALAAAFGLAACAGEPKAPTGSTSLKATLSGAAEVPPNSSSATGSLSGKFNNETNVLTWTVTYSGLSAPATAAHFHGPALPGQNAGVALGFKDAATPITGQATLNSGQAADLMAGKWYVNVHTATYPAGEIRGQVLTGP